MYISSLIQDKYFSISSATNVEIIHEQVTEFDECFKECEESCDDDASDCKSKTETFCYEHI